MHASTFFLAAAAQASMVAAFGNAIVANRCPYDIYLFPTSPNSSGGGIKIPARSTHTEAQATLGSMKISLSDSLEAGKQTQFEYSNAGGQLWYNLSFVDCASGESADNCPGHDLGLSMSSPDGNCGSIDCAAGSYCPTQAYYVDQPLIKLGILEPVFNCGASSSADLYMTVCSGESQLKRSVAGRVEIVEG